MRDLTIYLAGSYRRREELAEVAKSLEARKGNKIIARWLSGRHGASFEAIGDGERCASALEDLEDIDNCEFLVLFGEEKSVGYLSGGRMVELGYAIAQGKAIVIVGPKENVFQFVPHVEQVADVAALCNFFDEIQLARRIGSR